MTMSVATNKCVFNSHLPKPIIKIVPPNLDEWPINCFKNASFKFAYKNSNNYIRNLLDNLYHLANTSRRLLVDVKVHDLEPGDMPCIPGWHCDSVINPFHRSEPERHFIYVTGVGCLTEFIGEPVELIVEDPPTLENFHNQLLKKDFSVINLASCWVHEYGRHDFHRCSVAKIKERRLFVRLTETNLVLPDNRVRLPNEYMYR